MNKKLDIVIPQASHTPYITNQLAVLNGHNKFNDWLLDDLFYTLIDNDYMRSNYEQLINNENSPLITYTDIGIREDISNIIELIIENINNDCYMQFKVNMFYIPPYEFYNKHEEDHRIFVYGYDDDKKLLYIADFFKGIYELGTCTFKEMEDAFRPIVRTNNWQIIYKRSPVRSVKVNHDIDYDYDINKYKAKLQNYLDMDYPHNKEELHGKKKIKDLSYNLNFYNTYKEYAKKSASEIGLVYCRPFNLLRCHYILNTMRILYLVSKDEIDGDKVLGIIQQYNELINTSRRYEYSVLKYNKRKDMEIIRTIGNGLDSMRELDANNVSTIINLL